MAQLQILSTPQGTTLQLSGRLDAQTVAPIWPKIGQLGACEVDASGVTYCDGAGVALFYTLAQGGATIHQLAPPFAELLDVFQIEKPLFKAAPPPQIGWLTAFRVPRLGMLYPPNELRYIIKYWADKTLAQPTVLTLELPPPPVLGVGNKKPVRNNRHRLFGVTHTA